MDPRKSEIQQSGEQAPSGKIAPVSTEIKQTVQARSNLAKTFGIQQSEETASLINRASELNSNFQQLRQAFTRNDEDDTLPLFPIDRSVDVPTSFDTQRPAEAKRVINLIEEALLRDLGSDLMAFVPLLKGGTPVESTEQLRNSLQELSHPTNLTTLYRDLRPYQSKYEDKRFKDGEHKRAIELALLGAKLSLAGEETAATEAITKAKDTAKEPDYDNERYRKFLGIALAEMLCGSDNKEALDAAERSLMVYLGSWETRDGIFPYGRFKGLSSTAKVRMLSGLPYEETVKKIGTVEKYVPRAAEYARNAVQMLKETRSIGSSID